MYFQQDCPFEYVITLPCTYPEVYPGTYEVSNNGRVFNVVKGFESSICTNSYGYKVCGLISSEGCYKQFKVHRLVAWEFCPGRNMNLTVNHKDGNKLNNMYWNLEWCTSIENYYHAIEHGLINNRGEHSGRSKLTEQEVYDICQILKDPTVKITDIAKIYNVNQDVIKGIANGKSWRHITSQLPPLPERVKSGQYNSSAKLTEEQVHQIHQMKKHNPYLSYQELADQFNVSNSCITRILTGRTWKHIYSYYNPSSPELESDDAVD